MRVGMKTEIIIFTETRESAANWWKEDLLRFSQYGKPETKKQQLVIITPTCRIRYISRQSRAEGLRADLVWGVREDERKIFMCRSKYKKEDCTMENIRNIIIDGFKKGR